MAEKIIRDINSRKILGMPVFSCKEGLNLGNIRQVLVDIKTFTVQGFLLGKRKVAQYERILPFSAVFNFGEDSVTVETVSLLERRGQTNYYTRQVHRPPTIIGARVFTTGGRSLGKIEEYRFNSESGRITGLEIAPNGFFKVRTLVKGEHIIAITGNTAMLDEKAVDDAVAIENSFIVNMGNAADTVKEKAGEFMSSTADITKRISTSISGRLGKIRKREEVLNTDDYDLPDQQKKTIDVEEPASVFVKDSLDTIVETKQKDTDNVMIDVNKNKEE